MMLIKLLTSNISCCKISIAQGLNGKTIYTGFFVSVYKLRTWHGTQVSAVENSWGLCSDVFMHLHGSLMALLSPFTLCLFTLHLYQFISLVSGANKLISSLEKSAIEFA